MSLSQDRRTKAEAFSSKHTLPLVPILVANYLRPGFTDIKKGRYDCGCDLHSEGCFRWLTKTISVDDLSELCGMQFADKKKAFQELRTMLHNSATLMPDTDNTYELHYKLLGIHEVCRPAFLWASGWSCCWS
jgi:hypothetical protein